MPKDLEVATNGPTFLYLGFRFFHNDVTTSQCLSKASTVTWYHTHPMNESSTFITSSKIIRTSYLA
jgi:hypothetical protein